MPGQSGWGVSNQQCTSNPRRKRHMPPLTTRNHAPKQWNRDNFVDWAYGQRNLAEVEGMQILGQCSPYAAGGMKVLYQVPDNFEAYVTVTAVGAKHGFGYSEGQYLLSICMADALHPYVFPAEYLAYNGVIGPNELKTWVFPLDAGAAIRVQSNTATWTATGTQVAIS